MLLDMLQPRCNTCHYVARGVCDDVVTTILMFLVSDIKWLLDGDYGELRALGHCTFTALNRLSTK